MNVLAAGGYQNFTKKPAAAHMVHQISAFPIQGSNHIATVEENSSAEREQDFNQALRHGTTLSDC